MMQLSTIVFSLLVELLVVLSVVLGVWVFVSLKRSNKDRSAASKLVEQIRHQSELRLKETGSFLEEKYQFEGNELAKAIQSIDKAEKKFMQKVINMYLNREAHELEVMDASMAELIEAYKELTPVGADQQIVAEVEAGEEQEVLAELESLRNSNQQLTEELAITKQTMGNMIAEFGNMFGGGQESSLEKEEVLEKVKVIPDEVETDELVIAEPTEQEIPVVDGVDEIAVDAEGAASGAEEQAQPVAKPDSAEAEESQPKEKEKKDVTADSLLDFDEGIDELMDGIDLSED